MSRILQDQHPQQQNLYHTLGSKGGLQQKNKKKEKENVHKTKWRDVQIKSKQQGAKF